MRRLGEFFAGPDGKLDEMAFIAVLSWVLFALCVLAFLAFTFFAVVRHGQPFEAREWCDGVAVLFTACGALFTAMAWAMGIKAKLGG